jgi:hypothetical protein
MVFVINKLARADLVSALEGFKEATAVAAQARLTQSIHSISTS